MKQFVIVLGLIAAGVGGTTVLVLRDAAGDSRRQTTEAQAIGFAATPVKWWNGDENEEGHTLTFSWVDAANGVHTETMKEIAWYHPDRTYKVCYNPADPADWKLYSSDHACGS
jgi:hypothetical protein